LNVVGVVAALAVEARALGPTMRRREGPATLLDGTLLALSGTGSAAAARAARTLIDAGARALASWGLAGGLDPALTAGAVVLPSEVISTDGTGFATAPDWRERCRAAIAVERSVSGGKLLSSAQAIHSVEAKAAAFRATGAAAVDMESFAVARVAAMEGLPFIALRVIVDTAQDALPRAVMAASRSGRLHIGRLIAALALTPADIAPLIRLAQRYRAAQRALVAIARTGCLAPAAFSSASNGPLS